MNSRELIQNAFKCKPVERIPWVPFTGVHAGALIGVTAEEYLRSSANIIKGLQAVVRRYQPDGIPVVFDLQVEAEIFGCELLWAEENPPSVASHPLTQGKTLADFKAPKPNEGRLKIILAAARQLRQEFPEIALYGLVTGPFTLALHLIGTNIFMEMFDNPQGVRELMEFCRHVCETVAGYYIEAGCDVIAVVDPMTSQIGPDQFREFVTPFIKPVFDYIRNLQALSSFFVCGHAQQNIVAMCECNPDNVSVDENIPLDYVRDECLARNISFGGNIPLTTVLLLGSELDSKRKAIECLEIAGERGFILAPGCDLPYATPPKNLEAVTKIVRDSYEREVTKAITVADTEAELLDMRDYGSANKVVVDIITLDSEACAPCQYMVEAVKNIAPEFEGIVEWREHKIKHKESVQFMTSLMVKNIPTICIDGKITFVSRIPAKEELIAAIQQRIFEKLRLKIKRHHASVFILGDGGEKCMELQERVEQAATELGSEARTEIVTDPTKIETYGITVQQTPAVVVAKFQLKSTKTIPEVAIIKEWLKDLI